MADNRKLAQGLMMMTPAMRADLAGREQDIQRGKTVELLRRAGKEMYDNPIVNTAIGFAPVLGDIQAAGETMSALERGAPWQETAGYAAGMLPFIPMVGKTVWHGSPHTFDKFDLSKIGTGEGAQAYGHGLYLADAPEVAEAYRGGKEGMVDVFIGGKKFEPTTNAEKMALNAIRGESRSIGADPFVQAEKYFSENLPSVVDEVRPRYEEALQAVRSLKEQNPTLQGGSLYKVDLPDEQIAKMLDWDKPLSEQSAEIQELARNLDISNAIGRNKGVMQAWREGRDVGITPRGEHLYESLAGSGKYQPQASQTLYEAGIPGIQYLDQASRGAGEGTRNYVVFSDEIPQILERNNQPVAQALRDYRGAHTAPGPEFGAQLHDVTGGGQMYPEDIYSAQGARLYGHGGPDVGMDKETMRIIQQMRNKPDEMVDIYRAVPNEGDITAINAGDWVTINPNYAKQHGESNLPEGYKILQHKVPAKSVWTNADSIHEYGYWPE